MKKKGLIIIGLCLISSIIWGNNNKSIIQKYQTNENSLNQTNFSKNSAITLYPIEKEVKGIFKSTRAFQDFCIFGFDQIKGWIDIKNEENSYKAYEYLKNLHSFFKEEKEGWPFYPEKAFLNGKMPQNIPWKGWHIDYLLINAEEQWIYAEEIYIEIEIEFNYSGKINLFWKEKNIYHIKFLEDFFDPEGNKNSYAIRSRNQNNENYRKKLEKLWKKNKNSKFDLSFQKCNDACLILKNQPKLL
jgi:hypothetical protein